MHVPRSIWLGKSFAVCMAVLCATSSGAVNPDLATLRKVSTVTTTGFVLTSPSTHYPLSQSDLLAKLNARLRQGGLRVLSESEAANERITYPFVRLRVPYFPVTSSNGQTIGYVYNVELSLRLASRVPLNRASAPVELWQSSQVGFSPPEELPSSIDTLLDRFVDRLLQQWKSDN
jgi:hypothetical protein